MPGMSEQAGSRGGNSVRRGKSCPGEASLSGHAGVKALPPETVTLTP